MRIRLKVIAPGGASRLFEHHGPAVRVGRDPSCELLLEGDEGTAASRQHARIELSPAGATLIDLGSANKTQHNDQVVERPTPLRPGDRIQIGYTGAQLVVLDLNLAPPSPPYSIPQGGGEGRASAGGRRVLLVVGGGVAAFVLVAATVLLLQRDRQRGDSHTSANGAARDKDDKGKGGEGHNQAGNGGEARGVAALGNDDKGVRGKEDKNDKVEVKNPPPLHDAPRPARPDVQAVGHYLRPRNTRPSVLLQRYSEDQPWTALRDGEAVSTGHTLVSLPGYESVLSLRSGVRLNLWGSLPQLGGRDGSPVGECAVLLRPPEPGFDADVILDRGRVEIGSQKEKGDCVVRLSFLREQWDVTLKGPRSRVVAELIYRLAPGTPEDARLLGLFTQGDVVVKTRKKEYTFALPARLAWLSSRPDEVFDERLREVPAWWASKPAEQMTQEMKEKMKETLLFLGDWAEGRFHAPKAEPDIVYTMTVTARDQTQDPLDRELGLWFLAAIDEPTALAEFLRDPDPLSAALRTTALICLQDWLRRNGHLRGVLARKLQQRFSYPMGVATQMVRLLAPIPEEERGKAATYQELIDLLDHDDVGMRHLAFWHLYQGLIERRPEAAKKIEYDPLAEKKARREAQEKWRKLIPPGSVPPRRPAPEAESPPALRKT